MSDMYGVQHWETFDKKRCHHFTTKVKRNSLKIKLLNSNRLQFAN